MEILYCDICRKRIIHQESFTVVEYKAMRSYGLAAKGVLSFDLCPKCSVDLEKIFVSWSKTQLDKKYGEKMPKE